MIIGFTLDDLKLLCEVIDKSYPIEACGVIIGIKNDVWITKEVVPTRNELKSSIRFKIPAEDFYNADKKAERLGFEIIGIFHSHIDQKPYLSKFDVEYTKWTPEQVWVVIGYHKNEKKAEMKAFFKEKEIKIKIGEETFSEVFFQCLE